MEPYKFSIIIPHRNLPDLLRKCLDSVPHREDVQVVVVDDNSDSDIVDFDRFPGMGEPNVEVCLTKEGRGAGYARNVGLQHARGEWLLFVDSDDILCGGTEEAFAFLQETDADLVYFRVESRDVATYQPNREADALNEACRRFAAGDDVLKYHHEVPWGKAVRAELVRKNRILFDEVFCGNDSLFSMKCDYYAAKRVFHPALLYCWMTRSGSLWHKVDDKSYRTRFRARLHVVQFLSSVGEPFQWCDDRLKWYLGCIAYRNSFDLIAHYWQYAWYCRHYFLIFRTVIDQARVKLALGRFISRK